MPFSQAPWYALPVHLCRFRVRSITLGLFPGTPWQPTQSNKGKLRPVFVTTSRPRNINLVPIDYGFRPRLRGRLTLRGLNLAQETLDLRREGLSPSLSLLMSAFSLPIPPATLASHLHRRTERSATTRASTRPQTSVHGFSPDTSSAQDGLIRPVSYYAFFKGWLLLSQPPGCFGLPTSFPT